QPVKPASAASSGGAAVSPTCSLPTFPLPQAAAVFGGERGEEMAKSCKGLAMELVKCLSESECVKVQKRPYKECAGEKVPNITSECVGLRETYFNCKRGQVDMRARIRGNKGY
ncbi:unnamed protein product, partial [Urochloa humidicola]